LFSGTSHASPILRPVAAPTSTFETVTPELAEQWLQQNTHNRNVNERTVLAYARDMEAGRWADNGEAIKFAFDGTLLDGQHRLHAITLARVAVRMLVVRGLPHSAQETMDSGRKRTTGDVFTLRGEKDSALLASVLRRVWMWDRGDYRLARNVIPSTADCIVLLDQKPGIRTSVEAASRVRQQFRYLPPSIVGLTHWVFLHIDAEQTNWFFDRLGDGASLPTGHPVLTLRNRAMDEIGKGQRVPEDRVLAYVIRAWNAYRDGRTLARIQHGLDDALPMPK
jgi:hypothetical protein